MNACKCVSTKHYRATSYIPVAAFNIRSKKYFSGKLRCAESFNRCFIFQMYFGSALKQLSVFYTSGNVNNYLPLLPLINFYWPWCFCGLLKKKNTKRVRVAIQFDVELNCC